MRNVILATALGMSLSSGVYANPSEKKVEKAAEKTTETTKKEAGVVEIEGSISKVVPSKKEIYVKDAAGKKHEFYFTDTTTVTSGGAPTEFSTLKEGTKVKVKAEKHGKRLTPVAVEVQ